MLDNSSNFSIDYPDFVEKGEPNCSQVDPDLFFPEPDQPNASYIASAAKKICTTCPYVAECLAWALANNEIGIWGGTTENDRRRMKRGNVPLKTPKRWSGKA
jgi:WhiB family redox-sensing transcriptional regulator